MNTIYKVISEVIFLENEENLNKDILGEEHKENLDEVLHKDDLDQNIQEIEDISKKSAFDDFKDVKEKKDRPKSSFRFLILFFIILGFFTVLLYAIGQEPTWTVQYYYYKYYGFYNGFIILITSIFIFLGVRKLGIFKSIFILPFCFIIFLLFCLPLLYFMTDFNSLLISPSNYFRNNIYDYAFIDFWPVTSCFFFALIMLIVLQASRWIRAKAIFKVVALFLPIILIISAAVYFLVINPMRNRDENIVISGSEGLKADLDYILNNQKRYNIDFNTKEDQQNLEKKINELKGKVSEESFENLIVDIKKLNASYIDQNNDISYVGKAFPFVLYFFDDGYYVISNTKPFDNIYGKKLIEVNGKKIEDIEKLFLEVSSYGSLTRLNSLYAAYLSDYTVLRGLNIINSEESNFTFQDGSSKINVTAAALEQRELSKQLQDNDYEINRVFLYKQNKTLLKKNDSELRFVYQNYDSSVNFTIVEVLDLLSSNNIKTFFVDLRNSGEGNSRYFTKLVNAIKYRRIKIDNLICATDRDTILSGVIAAQDFKEILGGKSIGENTGGSISNCSNNRIFTTPNNNLKFNIITKENDAKGKSPIPVDDFVPLTSKDYFTSRDPAYEYIRNLNK